MTTPRVVSDYMGDEHADGLTDHERFVPRKALDSVPFAVYHFDFDGRLGW